MSDTNRPYGDDDGMQERAQKFIAGIPYAHNHSVKSCRACAGEMAEIAILRSRVAELEAELAKRPSASGGDEARCEHDIPLTMRCAWCEHAEARRSSPTDVTNVGCERCGGTGRYTYHGYPGATPVPCPKCGERGHA